MYIKKHELISIIVPVYNVENYLHRCLNSIISQTYKNLEIILIDDGSTDNSGVICDQYALKDNRIKVIHQQNKGQSFARNFAISISKGEYLSFIDSDDVIESDMIEHLKDLIDKYNVLMSVCNISTINEKNEIYPQQTKNSKIEIYSSREALEKCFTDGSFNNFLCNKLFNKILFNQIEQPNGLFEDMSIMYKIISKANKIARSFDTKYFYVIRENSLTNLKYDKEKSIKYLDKINEIIAFCIKKEWNTTADLIKNEKIYMIGYMLKKFFLQNYNDYEYTNKLRKLVLYNFTSLLKSKKNLFKKISILIFAIFFNKLKFIKMKLHNNY